MRQAELVGSSLFGPGEEHGSYDPDLTVRRARSGKPAGPAARGPGPGPRGVIGTALKDVLWPGGFGVELAGLSLTLIGAVVLGGALLRAGGRAPGVVLLTGAALAVPMTVVVRYIPHGTVLPLAVAIAAVSWLLIRQGAGAVGEPVRAGPA